MSKLTFIVTITHRVAVLRQINWVEAHSTRAAPTGHMIICNLGNTLPIGPDVFEFTLCSSFELILSHHQGSTH